MRQPDDWTSRDAPLTPEHWTQVRAIVEEALTLSAASRSAFIAVSSSGDLVLHDRIERLVAACERAEGSWGFLAQPAGELAAPLLAAAHPIDDRFAVDAEVPLRRGRAEMAEMLARLTAALADRYRIERELATGGMATVYLARDVRHDRKVAIKALHPELSAMLGAERFLSEIKTTAALHHPHILPLFDSGSADGLLFYVMPLVEGQTLRARLAREKQLPVSEAVRIVTEVADALEYAHRHGVVHRDIKPENILLHEGRPLVADFGIALAVQSAGAQRMTRTGLSLGTPPYMSPEQAAGGSTIDGRSDVYSLACVLYELLVGDPPFTGSTPQVVIARVLGDVPSSVRIVRPSVPAHIEAALLRALAKLPADRHASAREFAAALEDIAPVQTATPADASAPVRAAESAPARATGAWRRDPVRLALGAMAVVGLASAAWMASRTPAAPEVTRIPYANLIDQTLLSSVGITPNGRALVYTGTAEAGRPIMLQALDRLAPRVIRGTAGGINPFVAPDGQRLFFQPVDSEFRTISIDGLSATNPAGAWRYGNGAWDADGGIVKEAASRGLKRQVPGSGAAMTLTRPDTTRGESKHVAPLVLPGGKGVVFTISMHGGRGLVAGPLAIASLGTGSSPTHTWLGVEARRAFAFVDGWLLYVSIDGLALMAVRLDVEHRRIIGDPIVVEEVAGGNLEAASLADNGTLVYVRRPRTNAPVIVDASGAVHPLLPGVEGPFMYPRLAADGKRLALQAITPDGGNDVWVYDLATRTPIRLTTTGNALHPTWTPDGQRIVFAASAPAPRGLRSQRADGSAPAEAVRGAEGGIAPMVASDGKTVVFQRLSVRNGWDLWSASPNGTDAPRKLVNDQAAHYMPAVSPDGHWIADVSTATGQNEVYVRPYPGSGPAVQVSDRGGAEPAWSPDGHRLYYRTRDAFMVAAVSTHPAFTITSRRQLFKDTFDGAMPHRNYDVLPDGSGFLMLTGGSSETLVVINWLTELRARLAHVR